MTDDDSMTSRLSLPECVNCGPKRIGCSGEDSKVMSELPLRINADQLSVGRRAGSNWNRGPVHHAVFFGSKGCRRFSEFISGGVVVIRAPDCYLISIIQNAVL